MEDNLNLTATRIREMRLENKWTQKDLANKLGLKNDTAIANYEAGYSTPKDDIKLKMCDIFNCTMDYLMGKSDIRNHKEETKIGDLYMHLAKEAQNMQLPKEDVDYIISFYKRNKK